MEILSRGLEARLRLSEEDREHTRSGLRVLHCDLNAAERPYIHSMKIRQASPADKTFYECLVSIVLYKVDIKLQ